jgi:Domain of unknown function (DUF4922)
MVMEQEVDSLFRSQSKTWPLLARAVEGLQHAQTRPVSIDWFEVFIRHIPHRVVSTTAAVDRESIAKRPCFLCAENLYPEQKGLEFNSDYTIYCNPFPIVDHHLTIVHRRHEMQHIAGEIGAMLDIASALPSYFVIYNGPECGASAPDHMHFQAGSRALFPIEKDTAQIRGISVPNYARNVMVFRESSKSVMAARVNKAIELLAELTRKRPEPLVNIAATAREDGWTVYLFPRGKHRPQVYHTGELTVSPASMDLCGIFVVPFERDFERITAADVASIFREVTLSDDLVQEVVSKL